MLRGLLIDTATTPVYSRHILRCIISFRKLTFSGVCIIFAIKKVVRNPISQRLILAIFMNFKRSSVCHANAFFIWSNGNKENRKWTAELFMKRYFSKNYLLLVQTGPPIVVWVHERHTLQVFVVTDNLLTEKRTITKCQTSIIYISHTHRRVPLQSVLNI